MNLSKTQIAILCLIIANVIWGASSPIFKWALEDVQPFTFAFLRLFLSALILLPFTIHRLKIKRSDLYTLLFLAVIGLAFRTAYSLFGLKLTASINAPIIASATPIFLIIGSMVLFHEKTRKKVINGVLISFFGVLLVILQPLFTTGLDTSIIGNVFFLIAMALSVIYIMLLKELAPKYHPLTILFWIFTIASFALLPFTYFEVQANGIGGLMHMKAFIGIAFSVLFCTCIAYSLHIYGLKYIKTSEVGMFSYVDPFVAIAIAKPLLGEQVTTMFFFGAMLVFVGIFIAEGRIHYHPVHLLRRKESEVIKDS